MRASLSLLVVITLTVCFQLTVDLEAAEQQAPSKSLPLELKQGDRIVLIGNTFADQLRLFNYLETLLISQSPVKNITLRNLGWSGDTLNRMPRPLNFGSLDDHLHQQKADLILACYGMNESFSGQSGLKEFINGWEKFLKHISTQKYNGVSAPRVVMISPIAHEHLGSPLPDPTEHNQSLLEYSQAMKWIAAQNQILFVDLYSQTKKLMEENPSQKLTRNGIHLNEYGYWALGQFLAENILGKEMISPQLKIDLHKQEIVTTNAEILQRKFQLEKIQFTVKEHVLPIPSPPETTIVHGELLAAQPRLTIKNLPVGKYRLLVNKKRIAEASHLDWSRGLRLESLPSQVQVSDLRSTIHRKNELFFYVYRAHNAEYIFGRRTKPFGAVSFPPEMKAFNTLIQDRESKIGRLSQTEQVSEWTFFKLD